MSKSIGFYCPHCGRRMHVTGRKRETPIYHTFTVSCQNPECLASFAADMELTRQIQPSLKPRQDIDNQLQLPV